MIVNIARFLLSVGLVIGGLGGAFVLFTTKPELSFQVAFWGLLAIFILKGITKMSPDFAVYWRKVKCRMIVFRECFLVGLVYGVCMYVVAGLGGAALEGAGWSGAVDALMKAPTRLSPAGALALLFPTFGIIVGLFGGKIQLSPSSFSAPTNSHVVLWFLAHSDLFTVSRNVDRSVIRGRMIQGYAQSFRKLIGGPLPHLWFVFKDRLNTWKRRIGRLSSKLSAFSFISFEEKPTIDMAIPSEDAPNGNPTPRSESKADDTNPKRVRAKKKAVTKSEKVSEHKDRNGHSQKSNSKKLIGWVQDTLKFEKSNVSHPPIVLEAKVKKRSSVRNLRIFWAYSFLPLKEALGHFLVIGTPGSGKTVQMRLLMQSVFKNFGKGLNQRAVVYDGKRERKCKKWRPLLLRLALS